MPIIRTACALAAAAIALATPAFAKPPIEAFGDAPEIRAMDMSPDGKRLAYINRIDGKDYLVALNLETKTARALSAVTDIKPRYVRFVGNNYIVLVVSRTWRFTGYMGRYEYSGAFSYNITTGKFVQMLVKTPGLLSTQTGLGQIVGVDPGGKYVYMPAFMASSTSAPSQALVRVNLETGRGEVNPGYRGEESTIDWLIDASGKPIAREDFNENSQQHEILAYANGASRVIYTKNTDLPEISVTGISGDGKSLIATTENDTDFQSVYRMSMQDGALEGPILERKDAEIDGVVMDVNRIVYGVAYSGMTPRYEMFDKAVQADVAGVQKAFPDSSVRIASWSADWSKILFYVSGGSAAESYVLFDHATRGLTTITRGRASIKPEDIGEVVTIEYKASDGLTIPGLITWPVGVPADQRKNLPLVVMPHGGPATYDSIGFDWLAQFVANEGYAVLQPNFRGSAGYGASFRQAGYGQWGRKMQSDITDGVNALIKMGWADPKRVCIVGWSYGGYAALAGGALTPDLYKCVASVAGVSSLRDMLATEKLNHGPKSTTVAYWKMLIGDPDKDRDAIDAVSPAKLAANFRAPVLLIHGTNDLTVPTIQSDMMNDALKKADKTVEYIKINGDDHGLGGGGNRVTVLTKLSEFLAKHLK